MNKNILLLLVVCVVVMLFFYYTTLPPQKKKWLQLPPEFFDDNKTTIEGVDASPAYTDAYVHGGPAPASQASTQYISVIYTTYTSANVQYTTAGALSYTSYVGTGNTSTNKPVAIVCHGGGGTRSGSGPTDWAKEFASRGYYSPSADYGYEGDLGPFTNAYQKAAFSNICALVRYLRANAVALGINPNKIFLVGGSAGAITVEQAAIAAKFIDAINAGTLIDPFFNEPVNTENPTFSSVPTATGSAAGAVALLTSYLNAATPRNFFYNGTEDCQVAYSIAECGGSSGALETYNAMLTLGIACTFVPYLDAEHNISAYHDGMMVGGYQQVVGTLNAVYASNTFTTDIGLVRKFAALIAA